MKQLPRKNTSAVLLAALLVGLPGVMVAQTLRGGWPDRDWLSIYEGSFEDGADGEGLDIVGPLDDFDDLDGSWDHNSPGASADTTPWEGDPISDADLIGAPGGAQMFVRLDLGDNERGDDGAPDAETLAIFDANITPGAQPINRRIYFERFLTDGSVLPTDDPGFDDTGSGDPAIDFDTGITIVARFRFFSLDQLRDDPGLAAGLDISSADQILLTTVPEGQIEYDESPAESVFDQKGMFMVTRRDVYAGIGDLPGPGGIYFGMAMDGDDSWDPSNPRLPPPPADPVGVKVAYILDASDNVRDPEPGDSLVIAQLEARGVEVTILDDDGAEGHQNYVSEDLLFAPTGPAAVAHDHDLVLISSTVQSNAVRADEGRGYRDLDVPFINWENGLTAKGYAWLCDPFAGGFVIGSGAVGDAPIDSIEIIDPSHPITADFDPGMLQVFRTPQRVSATLENFGNVNARGVRILARGLAAGFSIGCLLVADPDCEPEDVPLCAADPGDPDPDCDLGDQEPPTARQVFFFLEDESFAGINTNGQILFHRAVEWALGDENAALLGPIPELPELPIVDPIPSFYVNLGASPAIAEAGFPLTTAVLRGSFLPDETNPALPATGGDTRVWAPLPRGTTEQFLAVYITVEPEAPGEADPIPKARVKVYFDGSTEPVIEIQNHSLDPDVLPAIFVEPDGSGPNDGTGLGMGLWREKQGGYLDVDYFGVLDSAVPPDHIGGQRFLRGDCNGDGGLDVADVICLVNTLFEGFNLLDRSSPDLPCTTDGGNVALLDVSGNGTIDVADIVGLANSLFGGGPPPDITCEALDGGIGCPASPGCQ